MLRARGAADAPADASSAADDAREDRAMSLALASLTPTERRKILEGVRYTTARLEARLSPLGDDLGEDDGDPMALFRQGIARYSPALNAARALERGAWRAADVEVRAVASCAGALVAPGEACVGLWVRAEGEPAMAERARFLAWAASRSGVLDLGARTNRDACADALRARATDDDGLLALVLGDDDLGLRPAPERPELEEAARKLGRAMAANRIADDGTLDAFARAAPSGSAAPWLTLGPSALLVVPRLSALVRQREVAGAVERAPACAGLTWTRRP